MKRLSRRSMKTVSVCGKSAWHGRQLRGQCFIRRQSFPTNAHRKRQIFWEDPERGNSRGMENRR
jgi:hypothetical protein